MEDKKQLTTFTTDKEIQGAKLPAGKVEVYLTDLATKNLSLLIRQTKRELIKCFYYKYKEQDKIKKIKIGNYPAISLHEARNKAYEFRTLRERGINLTQHLAELNKAQTIITLENVASEWINKNISDKIKSKATINAHQKLIKMLLDLLDPVTDIKSINRALIIATIDKRQQLEDLKGLSHDRSNRLFYIIKAILDYALNRAYIDTNPANDIRPATAFKIHIKKEYPAITDPKEVKELYSNIIRYNGDFTTRQALLFGIHTALRVGTLTALRWDFIDFDKGLITFPAQTMKTKQIFKLPLTRQTRAILEESKKANHFFNSPFVYPSTKNALRSMNAETPNKALKRMGLSFNLVFHSLRKVLSTLANENILKHGIRPEVIELCLSHKERNQIKAIYDKSERLEEKAILFQWWNDYLDSLLIDDKN